MNSNSNCFVNGISLKPHCAIGFSFPLVQHSKAIRPESNKASGKLSRKAKSKMNNAINWLHFLSEKQVYYSKKTKQTHKLYINFITLTLCSRQMHDDKYIVNRMLKPFLKWIKRQGNDLYVWRAEVQSNGNLHFHITSNRFLHWQSIRNKWNSIMNRHGYIREYIQSGGDNNPNSTDVSGVKNIEQLAGYMVKYMGKPAIENYCTRYMCLDDKPKQRFALAVLALAKDGTYITVRRDVTCKVWSCSTELQNKRITITEMDEGYEVIREGIEQRCSAEQKEGFTLFKYPKGNVFRNSILNYTDEQIARNSLKEENSSNP